MRLIRDLIAQVLNTKKSLFYPFGILLFAILGCKHEIPEPVPPASGNVPSDFFLVGDYIGLHFYDIYGVHTSYSADDSIRLRFRPVNNGIMRQECWRKDSLLTTYEVADYLIPSNENAYNWPYPDQTTMLFYDQNNTAVSIVKCFPSGANFGYSGDSLIFAAGGFGEVGNWYFYREP